MRLRLVMRPAARQPGEVDGYRQDEAGADPRNAAIEGLCHSADRLGPPEGFFDPVAVPDPQRIAFVPALPDVPSFETRPLAEDITIIGPGVVRLGVSTGAPDTDLTAKLIVVHPPSVDWPGGYAMIRSDGIVRLRCRDGWDASRLIEPGGGPFDITVEPFATANLFRRGHRIRLDISSSNFPKLDLNPSTGEPEGTSRRTRIATNTVHLRSGSRVELRRLVD